MKKIILLLVIVVGLSSCDTDVESYTNPQEEMTYVEYAALQDSSNIATVIKTRQGVREDILLLKIKDPSTGREEYHKAYLVTNTDYVRIEVGSLMFLIVLFFFSSILLLIHEN